MFNLNSIFNRKLTKIFDVCLLNILFLLTCIPLVTVGASMTALYQVMLAMTKDEEGPVLKMYFRAFRENFRQATIVWLVFAAVLALLGFDLWLWNSSLSNMRMMFMTITAILAVFVIMAGCWVFPLMAKFRNTTKNMIKNSFMFSMKFFPVSLSMGIVIIGYAVLVMEYFFTLWAVLPFLGVVILAYPWAWYVRVRFDKYIEMTTDANTIYDKNEDTVYGKET